MTLALGSYALPFSALLLAMLVRARLLRPYDVQPRSHRERRAHLLVGDDKISNR
jgi:hypothetical protein